jgi:hypothetical protein
MDRALVGDSLRRGGSVVGSIGKGGKRLRGL